MDKKNQIKWLLFVGVVIGVIFGWVYMPSFHNDVVGKSFVFVWLICSYGLVRFKKWAMVLGDLLFGIIFCYETFSFWLLLTLFPVGTFMQRLGNATIHNWHVPFFILSALLWFVLFSKKSVRSMFS